MISRTTAVLAVLGAAMVAEGFQILPVTTGTARREGFQIHPLRCSANGGDGEKGGGDGSYRQDTGRQHKIAEGLDANEMTEYEFRVAMREKMAARRRTSKGSGESMDYMAMLQGQPVTPKEINPLLEDPEKK